MRGGRELPDAAIVSPSAAFLSCQLETDLKPVSLAVSVLWDDMNRKAEGVSVCRAAVVGTLRRGGPIVLFQ